ncbi:hypothetical protein EDD18DRAFT_1202426 [Armillaria luteobubalina]|uniref:Uncharacterized protein n=1 Tax=Armillaria luteobubalina TaxID=153913 RepID=A0AA39PDD4_9AGAR|nr:hypothetical protein EDD18DRAFT_1202426 [Armillaria luteobubalina]
MRRRSSASFSRCHRRISVSLSRTQSLSSIQEEPEDLEDHRRPLDSDDDELESGISTPRIQISSTWTTPEPDDFSDALQSRLLEAKANRQGFRTSWIRQSSNIPSFSQSSSSARTPGLNRIPSATTLTSLDSDFCFSPCSEDRTTVDPMRRGERNSKRRRDDSLEDTRSLKRVRSNGDGCSYLTNGKTPLYRGLERLRSRRHRDTPSPRKKPRLTHRSYSASQPASLRRAQSLQTDFLSYSPNTSISRSSTHTRIITPTGTFLIPRLGQSIPNAGWIPTAPSTPEPPPVPRKNNNAHLPPEWFLPIRLSPVRSMMRHPVPVIAPPSNHAAVPPLSLQAQAKRRLQLYVLRERQCHQSWELQCRKESTLEDWEDAIGVGQKFRREVVEWILEVTLRRQDGEDLHDQLTSISTSRETRFHAAYLFILFFFRSGGATGKDWDGFEDMVWDMAVGAVAVSVKYHRDFLPPLLPVYAPSFQAFAPHEMGFDDLEDAQADLLSALGYALGGTPVGVLDELEEALPSLRELFPSYLDDGGEWDLVLQETWRSLMICILEPDILSFPISLLSAAAVSEAILDVLLHRKVRNYDGQRHLAREEVEEEAEGVLLDIQNVLEIGEKEMLECRRWIVGVKRDWCVL